MTMSYDFQVTIEAESEEAAKAKFRYNVSDYY